MASSAAGAEEASLYLVLHFPSGSPRVHRLVPTWKVPRRFTDDDPLGLPCWDSPGSPDADLAGSPTAACLLAVRDGAVVASLAMSPARESGDVVDSSSLNSVHLLLWPRHVSVKIFRGLEADWVSTSVYYAEEVADGNDVAPLGDLKLPDNIVGTRLRRMDNDQVVKTHHFIGCFQDSQIFSFSPLKMKLGSEVVKKGYKIGHGSAGHVFKCRVFEQYEGALKICSKFYSHREPLEISILSMLHHENVLQFYCSARVDSENMYICTELCERSLLKYINERSEDQMATNDKIFQEVVLGLAEVHKHKIVHRDMKPDNILLDANNSVRLIDFGLSVFQPGGAESLPGRYCGTPFYMAPEMRIALAHDEKVDIYSTGIVYYLIYASKEMGSMRVAPDRKKVAATSQLKQKAHFSKNWKHCGDVREWNKYKFSVGWEGDVSLLRRMITLRSRFRPTACEILDIIAGKSSTRKLSDGSS